MYKKAELDVITFDVEDVITTSGPEDVLKPGTVIDISDAKEASDNFLPGGE